MKKINQEISEKIKELRSNGWSQEDIAEKVGLSQAAISLHFKKVRKESKIGVTNDKPNNH